MERRWEQGITKRYRNLWSTQKSILDANLIWFLFKSHLVSTLMRPQQGGTVIISYPSYYFISIPLHSLTKIHFEANTTG